MLEDSTAPKGAVNAVPRGQERQLALIGLLGFIALMIAVPLRYYVGGDAYDERFSWRMFSAVRVQQCTLTATETVEGRPQALSLMEILPAPWVALLERNRPAVIRRFMAYRCGGPSSPTQVELTHACHDASGDVLPPLRRTMDCASRVLEEVGGADPDAASGGTR